MRWRTEKVFIFVGAPPPLRCSVNFASITHYFIPTRKCNPFFGISNHQNHHDESDILLAERILCLTGELWAAKAGRSHISQYTLPSFLLMF